jgi:cysteinyl-tRNA synthetase
MSGKSCAVLSVFLKTRQQHPKMLLSDQEDAKINDLVAKRQAARKAKNYAEADAIRKQLTEMGIILEDTPQGPEMEDGNKR